MKEKDNPEALLKIGMEFQQILIFAETDILILFSPTEIEKNEISAYTKKLIENLWLLAR